jgi:hypothetical protein
MKRIIGIEPAFIPGMSAQGAHQVAAQNCRKTVREQQGGPRRLIGPRFARFLTLSDEKNTEKARFRKCESFIGMSIDSNLSWI